MNGYIKKMGLMVGASTFALGMFAAAPATAFDDVDWTWTATVTETVLKDVDIDIVIAPTGLVMLEDLQIQIGDVTATSTVNGIYNNQPTTSGDGGPVEVDLGSITLDADYGLGGAFLPGGTADPTVGDEGPDDLSPTVTSGQVDETDVPPNVNGNVTAVIDLGTITVEVEPTEGVEFDALTELPEVVSTATAVGNNTTIEADTAVELHEAQILVGSIEFPTGEDGSAIADGVSVLGLGVTPAEVSATSTVYDILNASVDSSATAVGNNLVVDIEATGPDRLFMADVLQLSVANVTATSEVYDVTLNSYINLGEIDRPIVSSVATAVGNNKSISVNAPDIDVGGDDDGGGE